MELFRIVIDTNTLLRGLASRTSAASKVLRAAEQRNAIPLLSKPIVDEYQAVLLDDEVLARFPAITPNRVEMILKRLRYVGDYVRTPTARFPFHRDPLDEKFLELAISADATHIVSADRDLLSLPQSRTEAGKRFRQRLGELKILDAAAFLRRYETDRFDT